MTADVIKLTFIPKMMECCACDSGAFSLHVDGSIRCLDCGGKINAKWERTTSSSQPSDGAPSDAA